jgi:hypothetical protein
MGRWGRRQIKDVNIYIHGKRGDIRERREISVWREVIGVGRQR